MKIYEEIILNAQGEVIYEKSYEHFGLVALCGGPGAAGGGGTGYSTIDGDLKTSWREMFDDSGAQTLSAGNTLIEVLDAAVSDGGNPFEGETAYNPSSDLANADTQLSAYETLVDALAHETDADSAHTKALELVGDMNLYDYTNMPDFISQLISRALASALSDAAALVASANVVSTKVSSYRSEADTDEADALSDAETAVDGLQSTAITTSDTILDTAKAGVNVDQKLPEAFNLVDTIRTRLKNFESDFDVSGLDVGFDQAINTDFDVIAGQVVDFVSNQGKSVIDTAMSAAKTAVDSTIDSIVTSYETRQDRRTARAVNRFVGSMAESNAVLSSTFVTGIALIHSDNEDQAVEFEAALYRDIFGGSLQAYISALVSELSMGFNTAMAHIKTYIDKLTTDKNTYSQLLGSLVSNYLGTYIQALGDNIELVRGSIKDYNGAVLTTANAYHTNKLNNYDVLNRIQSVYDNLYADIYRDNKTKFVEKLTDAIRANDTIRSTHALQSLNTIMTAQQGNMSQAYQLAHLSGEMARMKTIAFSEQFAQNLQIDIGAARWDLEAFQYAANIFGGFTGGTVATPVAYTKAQTALSGALAGASIGASTGNPAGVLVGALIGGIGGALMR